MRSIVLQSRVGSSLCGTRHAVRPSANTRARNRVFGRARWNRTERHEHSAAMDPHDLKTALDALPDRQREWAILFRWW
jgi:hypothetical protein